MNSLPPWTPWALIVIGSIGMIVGTVRFVRVTIPNNYGSNPGFGVYEAACSPWWLCLSVGVAARTSPGVGAVLFMLGLFGLGFFAQLLGRLFGN
ncbi:MAG: hypothetical protein L7S64_11250 [Longimicrobiales bacterium]|nr:hypothetical protein [Longimicrobiales bacterium]